MWDGMIKLNTFKCGFLRCSVRGQKQNNHLVSLELKHLQIKYPVLKTSYGLVCERSIRFIAALVNMLEMKMKIRTTSNKSGGLVNEWLKVIKSAQVRTEES